MDDLQLRALEPEDISVLFDTENTPGLWKYSNRNAPFSKFLLKKYLEIQHQDIYESKQQRFVLLKLLPTFKKNGPFSSPNLNAFWSSLPTLKPKLYFMAKSAFIFKYAP